MKAIILAAGRGSRMKSLTKSSPKCLLKVKNRPLLEYQLEAIRNAGITEIAIITGYKSKMLSSYHLHEFYNSRWQETNMVSSLECANDWLLDEPCIVSYSDIFYQTNAINSLMCSPHDITITYDPDWQELWEKRFSNPLDDAETFLFNDRNELVEIGKKTTNLNKIQGQYMGLIKFTPSGWFKVLQLRNKQPKAERDKSYLTDILQNLINHGEKIQVIPYKGTWGEVDSPWDLEVYDGMQHMSI